MKKRTTTSIVLERSFTTQFENISGCVVQGFEKRNDEQVLELMNAYVIVVLDELTTLYLHIKLVMNTVKKKDQLNQRGARSFFHHFYCTT
ncbi:hypothetical protein Hanom_Chr03g00212731 [Helianthus anomalus]